MIAVTLEPAGIADAAAIAALRTAVAERLTAAFGKGHWSYAATEKGVLSGMKRSSVYVAKSGSRVIATLTLATRKLMRAPVASISNAVSGKSDARPIVEPLSSISSASLPENKILRVLVVVPGLVAFAALGHPTPSAQSKDAAPARSCFLLYEVGVREVRRNPSSSCTTRVSPASTFKIPHALAALDSGVIAGPDVKLPYDGAPTDMENWRRDHTLATAMRYSVVWYFQRIAERLGADRERDYLKRFDFGNADSSSGLTTFWLGGSLQISPEEQQRFILRLYADTLPAKKAAMQTVRQLIVQHPGVVTNATGDHPFDGPWPAGTIVSAKTGSATDRGGSQVRWIVGHLSRGKQAWVFVSNVIGSDLTALAAVEQAARALREEHVLP